MSLTDPPGAPLTIRVLSFLGSEMGVTGPLAELSEESESAFHSSWLGHRMSPTWSRGGFFVLFGLRGPRFPLTSARVCVVFVYAPGGGEGTARTSHCRAGSEGPV